MSVADNGRGSLRSAFRSRSAARSRRSPYVGTGGTARIFCGRAKSSTGMNPWTHNLTFWTAGRQHASKRTQADAYEEFVMGVTPLQVAGVPKQGSESYQVGDQWFDAPTLGHGAARSVERLVGNAIEREFLPLLQRRHLAAH
jgi:hypothetical protein